VKSLLDDRSDQIARVVHELVAQAARQFEMTVGRFDRASRAVSAMLEAQAPTAGVTRTCPACSHQGRVLIATDEVEGFSYGYLAGFLCPVCGLELEADMLEAAGIDDIAPWGDAVGDVDTRPSEP